MMRMLSLTLVLTLFVALTGCGGDKPKAAMESREYNATVLTVGTRAAWECREFPATVTARSSATLASKVSGTVTAVLASEGDLLKPGQTVLVIDERDRRAGEAGLVAAVSAAESERRTAEAKRDQAAVTLNRMRALADQGAISREEYDQARTSHESLARQVESLEARRVAATHQLEEYRAVSGYGRIASPLRGVLARRLVDQGAFVTQGQALAVIDDLAGPFELTASVDESLTGAARVGGTVLAVVPSLGQEAFATRIKAVVRSVDPASRSFTVKAELKPGADNATAGPQAGMFGRLALPVTRTGGIYLPVNALRYRGDLPLVFVIDAEGVLRMRLLRLGAGYRLATDAGETYLLDGGTRPEVVEVLAGLAPGERVAVGLPETAVEGDRLLGPTGPTGQTGQTGQK